MDIIKIESFNDKPIHFPLFRQDYGSFTCFPLLSDFEDENGQSMVHPLIAEVKNGGELKNVIVHDSWRDDSCDCFDVTVEVNGKTYGFSAWWLSQNGVAMLYGAAYNNSEALAELKQYIIGCDY